jgi:hypothetical protein
MNGGYERAYCEQGNKVSPFVDQQARKLKGGYAQVVTAARNLEAKRQAQEAAAVALQQSEAKRRREQAEADALRKQEQLREQARRDKEATAEALRKAEVEEPIIADWKEKLRRRLPPGETPRTGLMEFGAERMWRKSRSHPAKRRPRLRSCRR